MDIYTSNHKRWGKNRTCEVIAHGKVHGWWVTIRAVKSLLASSFSLKNGEKSSLGSMLVCSLCTQGKKTPPSSSAGTPPPPLPPPLHQPQPAKPDAPPSEPKPSATPDANVILVPSHSRWFSWIQFTNVRFVTSLSSSILLSWNRSFFFNLKKSWLLGRWRSNTGLEWGFFFPPTTAIFSLISFPLTDHNLHPSLCILIAL